MAHLSRDARKLPSIKSLNLHRGQAAVSGGVAPGDHDSQDAASAHSPDDVHSISPPSHPAMAQRQPDTPGGPTSLDGAPSDQPYHTQSVPYQQHYPHSNQSTPQSLYFDDAAFSHNHQYEYQGYLPQTHAQHAHQNRLQHSPTAPNLPQQSYAPPFPAYEGWSSQASPAHYNPSSGPAPNREPTSLESGAPPTLQEERHHSVHGGAVEEGKRSKRGMILTILGHCNAICTFASRYATLSLSQPNTGFHGTTGHPSLPSRPRQPPASEVKEMAQRARLVLDLVEKIKRNNSISQPTAITIGDAEKQGLGETGTLPKGRISEIRGEHLLDDNEASRDSGAMSLAEKDMQTIRSKRSAATQVASNLQLCAIDGVDSERGNSMATNVQHSSDRDSKKARKKGRTTTPGKCHSCNIRETPEWRRGPDGARTLCNACGLHYAKLLRRRDKALNSPYADSADTAPIDTDMVRASSQRGLGYQHGGPNQSRRSIDASPSQHNLINTPYQSLDSRGRAFPISHLERDN